VLRESVALAVATVALVGVTLGAQARETFRILSGTTVTVQVEKGGVFSFAGHEHEVVAPATDGQVTLDRADMTKSAVRLVFDAAAMKVTGKGEPADDVPEVQRVMLSDRVLDVQRYPTITFESRAISRASGSALRIDGDLTLHGMTKRISVPVQLQLEADRLTAQGKVEVRQTDFGMRPVTAAGGSVKVKDEVTVTFAITASRR
jgi:polyisoprenoid-binding protein YceI